MQAYILIFLKMFEIHSSKGYYFLKLDILDQVSMKESGVLMKTYLKKQQSVKKHLLDSESGNKHQLLLTYWLSCSFVSQSFLFTWE